MTTLYDYFEIVGNLEDQEELLERIRQFLVVVPVTVDDPTMERRAEELLVDVEATLKNLDIFIKKTIPPKMRRRQRK